jgi:DNA-binding MarR family transcriptional regulator
VADLDRKAVAELVAENYPALALRLLRPLLDLFTLGRESCGGDLDKFLIMLVIAVRTTEHGLFATYTQAQLLSGEIPVFPTLGTNVRSIAASVGLPRESVRRKVAELVEAGWIKREGNELQFTTSAYQDLARAREAIEQLAVRNFETVSSLIRSKTRQGQA